MRYGAVRCIHLVIPLIIFWELASRWAVREKNRYFKLWKAGGSRAAYNTAKRTSNCAVHQARSEAETVALQKIDPRSGDVYRLAKQMRRDNQDVMGEKPVKNDAGQLSLDEEAKKEAWREHYEHLLNVEFPWNPEDLSEESPVEGPSEPITLEMITKAISKMASGKAAGGPAAGPSGIVAEMLKPVGEAGAVRCVISLRTSSRTGRKASLSICTRAKGML